MNERIFAVWVGLKYSRNELFGIDVWNDLAVTGHEPNVLELTEVKRKYRRQTCSKYISFNV